MKRSGYCLVFLVILLGGCKGKTIPKREIYNEDFKWTITLPENFEQVNEEECNIKVLMLLSKPSASK